MNTTRTCGSSHTLPCNQNPPVRHTGIFSAKQVSIIKAALSKPKHAERKMLLEAARNVQKWSTQSKSVFLLQAFL